MFNPKFDKNCVKLVKKEQYLHKIIDFLRKLKQSGKNSSNF